VLDDPAVSIARMRSALRTVENRLKTRITGTAEEWAASGRKACISPRENHE
jgi:hypothetical protein